MTEVIDVSFLPTGRLIVTKTNGERCDQSIYDDLDEAIRAACKMLRPEWHKHTMGTC